MTVEVKDNKGNINNIGLVNVAFQNNVELTLEQKAEIKANFIEFTKAIIGNLTYKFIGNFKLKKARYEQELLNELEKIETNKIVEPRLSIVGPTIENLKYNLDEEQIRKMYTKILAGELNANTHSKILPAYIEIIKQLSKNDAEFLMELKNTQKLMLSVCNIRLRTRDAKGYTPITTIIVNNTQKNSNHIMLPKKIILDNLERLQLIKITDTLSIPHDEKAVEKAYNYWASFQGPDTDPNIEYYYESGLLEITDFGKQFIDICCS